MTPPTPLAHPTSLFIPCEPETSTPFVEPQFDWQGIVGLDTNRQIDFLTSGALPQLVIEPYPSPSVSWQPLSFSPNGLWYGYISWNTLTGQPLTINLYSIDTASAIEISPQLPPNLPAGSIFGLHFVGWINNDLILIDAGFDPESFLLVLNPFTGEWQTDLVAKLPVRLTEAAVKFSPDLTRAVVVTGSEYPFNFVLWDVETQQEIWQTKDYSITRSNYVFVTADIAWSSDSEFVALPLNDMGDRWSSLAIFRRDGQQVGLPTTKNVKGFGGASWSPDGQKLAVLAFASANPEGPGVMAFYDRATQAVVEVCLSVGNHTLAYFSSRSLLWSPDGRYVLFGSGSPNDLDETNQVLALDTIDQKLVLLWRGAGTVLGWSPLEKYVIP